MNNVFRYLKGSVLFVFAFILFVAPISNASAIEINGIEQGYFVDLNEHTMYFEAISDLHDLGILQGYQDLGLFKPTQQLSRSELLKIAIVSRARYEEGLLTMVDKFSGEACFTDVPAGAWFTGYVCLAKSRGWVQGYADGTFRPGDKVNFVEALKITMEALYFPFVKTNDVWYKGYVLAATDRKLIPYSVNSIGDTFTRSEMAELTHRMMKILDGEVVSSIDYGFAGMINITYESLHSGKKDYVADFLIGDDAVLGSSSAPVTVAVFTDMECPFCANFSKEILPAIQNEYINSGRVKFVYKDFPLTSIHTNALDLAMNAECYEEQAGSAGYYAFVADVYNSLSSSFSLVDGALKSLDADMAKQVDCMNSFRPVIEVMEDINFGESLGVTGTPYIFINDNVISGAYSYEEYKKVIDATLLGTP